MTNFLFGKSHPGGFIKRQCLDPCGLSIEAAAAGMRIPEDNLRELINGEIDIDADYAIRLSRCFGGGVASWIVMQMDHDIATCLANGGEEYYAKLSSFREEK